MKKFEFSLGRMMDYKQSLLEKEKNTLMQLFVQRNAIEDAILENEERGRETGAELRRMAEEGTTVAELQRMDYKLAAIRRQQKKLKNDLADIEMVIDKQREIVTEASQQVKGLELLKENQLEDYNYAARKEEDERIAELISSKIAREQSGMER